MIFFIKRCSSENRLNFEVNIVTDFTHDLVPDISSIYLAFKEILISQIQEQVLSQVTH